MFLNIITPCTRPENLNKIAESINIPRDNYRWIVIFDIDYSSIDIPENCEYYYLRDANSIVGNAQRNFVLDLLKNKRGYLYSNDDDTTIHPNLWENIKDMDDDFISFMQENMNGNIRLSGEIIEPTTIDNHNFIVALDIIGDSRFKIDRYDADGIFAKECYVKARSKRYLPIVLSTYNSLRQTV
jgi:hypothetical protein